MTYPVKIYWKQGDSCADWNEKCIQVMEHFGLPGHKYTTTVTDDYMSFNFNQSEDAVLFKLKCL